MITLMMFLVASDLSAPASAEASAPTQPGSLVSRRVGVGLFAGVPGDNAGPTKGMRGGLTVRVQLAGPFALSAGVGLPLTQLGVSGWLNGEIAFTVAGGLDRWFALLLYAGLGVQLGAAGPDYWARHFGVFVGYQYSSGGPLAFALRLPIGVSTRWLSGLLELYVEVLPVLALTPAVEVFVAGALGMRVHF